MTDQTTENETHEDIAGVSGHLRHAGGGPRDEATQNHPTDEGVGSTDTLEGGTHEARTSADEPETFPREYVEKLRREAAEARVKAKRSDELAASLWRAQVAATGRLADPTDLPMPEGADPLDAEAVEAAVVDLLARKPHLAARRPMGSVGQGPTTPAEGVDLAGMLRARA